MQIHTRLLALLLLFWASASFASEADRSAIEKAAQSWVKAYNDRNPDALVALTTTDVVLLDPTLPPVSGRDAARNALNETMGAATARLTSATKEIVVNDDTAWRIAALTFRPARGLTIQSQSLEIWKRVQGEWKLHRQLSAGTLAQPRMLRPSPAEPVLDRP